MSRPSQPALSGGNGRESPNAAHLVLDAHDVVVRVDRDLEEHMAPFVGHVLWEHLPQAEPLLRPGFDQARASGQPVTFAVFYAGRLQTYEAVPAGDRLAITVEYQTELNVKTLAMLARSLKEIEAELAAPERARPDLPAHASPRALP